MHHFYVQDNKFTSITGSLHLIDYILKFASICRRLSHMIHNTVKNSAQEL